MYFTPSLVVTCISPFALMMSISSPRPIGKKPRLAKLMNVSLSLANSLLAFNFALTPWGFRSTSTNFKSSNALTISLSRWVSSSLSSSTSIGEASNEFGLYSPNSINSHWLFS